MFHITAAVMAIAGLAVAATVARPSEEHAPSRARVEAGIRDRDIAFYRARVERDPYGAADRAQLANLFLQRARDRGDHGDLIRAEDLARRSLRLRRGRNGAAFAILASSLLAQHRFVEALDVAGRLVQLDSASPGARAMLGEIQLELGRYDEAAGSFGAIAMRRADPSVASRYARWEELRGRPEEARRLLRLARGAARGVHAAPAEQLAWFQLRLGDLAMRHGRLDEAQRELERGLAASPDDYRLLGAMARLELIRGRPRRAIEHGERAIIRTLDPAALAVLHDAHAAAGDRRAAAQYSRAMEVAVLSRPGALHRAWSMFLLDQGREVSRVLARAEEEIATRRDVYGWDLLAWSLYHAGQAGEASEAMTHALALGTRDAVLHYHAGMIALATGDSAAARAHLGEALAINPHWHHTQPAAARAILSSLVPAAHPVHTSVAQLREKVAGGAIEVAIRAFPDDLLAVVPGAGTRAADSALARYVRAGFVIVDRGGRPVELDWRGAQRVGDELVLRLTGESPAGLAGASVRHGLLLERFEDQVNVVHATYARRTATLLFVAGDSARRLP